LKLAGFFGVEPVARAGNFGKAGVGEEALYRVAVRGLDVVAVGAGQEQRWHRGLRVDLAPADGVGHGGLQRVQIETPCFRFNIKGLQKESAHTRVGLDHRKGGVSVRAFFHLGQVHATHGSNQMRLRVAIGDGRDIRNDQAVDEVGLRQGQRHRGLASHRMTENIGASSMGGDDLCQIGGQIGVLVAVKPRAVAVVAHVYADHMAVDREAFGDDAPITRRAEQAVGDEQGRVCGRCAMRDQIQHVRTHKRAIQDSPEAFAMAKLKGLTGGDSVMLNEELLVRSDRIATMMEERLGVRGKGLEAKLNRAGRRLPKWVRREAERLVQAERVLGHPKLMMQTDPVAINDAAKRREKYLKSVDPAERRKDAILGFLAVNSLNMLLIAASIIAYMAWLGHL